MYPRGVIAQTERGSAHSEFVETVQPEHVLLKIQYARQLLKRGVTADERFPDDVTVITTTSIRDGTNAALPLEGTEHKRGEREIVRDFEPDYHIPADRADYIDFSDEKRYERVEECMTGTLTMANHVKDDGVSTKILPWVKGVTPNERWLSYRTIEQLGLDYGVYYCNGYFNDRSGDVMQRIDDLIADVDVIIEEANEMMNHTDDFKLCLLSCLSPNILQQVHENVVAASGLWVRQDRGWREKIVPTKQSDERMNEIYDDAERRILAALGESADESDDEQETSTVLSDTDTSDIEI
jgi:hypothetical protein